MILKELLKKYSNEQIIDSLHKNYADINDEAYLIALEELRNLKPSKEKQDIKIIVEFEKGKDNNLYLICDGVGPDPEFNNKLIRWGLEYNEWENWLAMEIEENCLSKLDELTILAGILWEMTYNGYTSEDVNTKREELERRYDETKNPENRLSFDELIKELENDN